MDEKEQADRLAAAEALYMISTRVDKSGGGAQKSPRISRKKRYEDSVEERSVKRKIVGDDGDRAGGGRRGRRNSGRGAVENRGSSRGRGGRGGGSSPRGRGAAKKALKSPQKHTVSDAINITHETLKGNNNNNGRYNKRSNVTAGENKLPQNHSDDVIVKQKSKARAPKVRQKTKSNPSPLVSVSVEECSQGSEADVGKASHQAIGLTGAAISLSDPVSRRSSFDSPQSLQSHGLVSGLKQVTLTSRTLSSTTPMFSLPSMNLASFTPDVNLPSIPLEIGSLQLSSQPTPNLSSLGDFNEGVFEDNYSFANRKKSEKFLPLKKRKLLNPSEPEAKEETSAVEASSLSDSEERSDPQSPPPAVVEPFRASFTVQAPPIITMQTLMEIKTALTPDDDGDLPLHIAVVHENMRMVAKLIALMKIAGKGVDKFNKQQQTPLHLAVKLNFLEAVDILLKSSANVNAVDCTGSSCIHMAVQGKSTDCLTMLLERCPNADLNARNFEGLTPLHIAVDNGDLEQVETLLKYNADIDVTDGKSGRTALFWAAESNQKAMVELLLGKGANADVPNYAGVTTAMAAQGRNLHGVLKLLGSAATDKFTEFDVKPTLESKPSPLYLGLPSSENLAFSHRGLRRSISLSRHPGLEVTCLVEPKINVGALDVSSDETKVFKNVFVLSQNQTKSMSEPSSPEVKMEVTEDKDDEPCARSGLMSLPESIFSKTEEDRGTGHLSRRRKVVMSGLGGSLLTSKGKLQLPAVESNVVKNSEVGGQRNEQKSVLLHMVPSFSRVGTSLVASLASASNPAQPASSDLAKKSLNASTVVSPSSVTLTNMQARLFQMLLTKYNIDPSNEAATTSSDSRLGSAAIQSPAIPLKPATSPATLPLPLTQSRSVPAPVRKPYTQPFVQISVRNSGGSLEQAAECNGSSSSFSQPRSPYQHKLVSVLANNHRRVAQNGVLMESEDSKALESPLNLSTTSGRQDNCDSRNVTSSTVPAEISADAKHSLFSSQSSLDGGSSSAMKINPALLGLWNPVRMGSVNTSQTGSSGKTIAIDVHNVSEHADSEKVGSDVSSRFEMFLVQNGPAQIPVTVASEHLTHSGVTTSMMQNDGSLPPIVSQPQPTVSVDAVSDSSHITSVSQQTAFIVRDYLTQQNQIRIQNRTFPSHPVSAASSMSSIRSSFPTVLELAAEDAGSAQKKHVVALARNPPPAVSRGKPSSYATSVSNTLLLPIAPPSPVFLHQGHVIDLSRSKPKETSSSSKSQSLPSSSGRSDSLPGEKIIGFSGAVLSVAPSKVGRVDKPPPREATPKEFQKKRGRKSQKSMPGLNLPADAGLSKINSETDEKLKKFLDAKKSENNSSILLSSVDGLLGLQNEQTDGLENDVQETENPKVLPESHSEGHINKTYKTMGIFSGNVQHMKVVNNQLTSASVVPALPDRLLSSQDNKISDPESLEGECTEENISSTSSTILSPTVSTTTNKPNITQASKESVGYKTLDCKKESSENEISNYSSDVILKSMGVRLRTDCTVSASKKSKKRVTKSASSCVKEQDDASLNEKEASLRLSSSEFDSAKSSHFVNEKLKLVHSGTKHRAVSAKVKGNGGSGVKEKKKNVLSKTSLETVKPQERDSVVCDNSQAFSPICDSFPKHKKRQRRKKLGLQEKEQVPTSSAIKQGPFESQKTSCDSNIQDLTSRGALKSDSHNVFSSQASDNNSIEKVDVFDKGITTADDDDDDDFDGQPTLVIEEDPPEMS